MKPRLMFPRIAWSFNPEDGSDGKKAVRVERDTPPLTVGETIVESVAAPGIGKVSWKVTRVDRRGVWGVVTKNTVREMTAADAK